MSLAHALDLEILGADIVRLPKAHAGLLFGSGKIDEIQRRIEADEIGLVLIDGPVTPIQQRNLERKWKVKVLDRTGLILEIFGDRARTREGVLQVDLAALQYQRSRLVRSWTHLERQRGGLSFVGGAGETQIEADRRAMKAAGFYHLGQLPFQPHNRVINRAARKKVPYPIVALVGYTNAGKSTIFNHLTGAEVLAKDMLFATLDPTMRAIMLPNGREVILSDTVGFISDLPTQLVAAFRATLEEVLDADLILHVRDITHPETEEQAADVHEILSALGISDRAEETALEVWNKIDLAPAEEAEALRNTAIRSPRIFATSAVDQQGFPELLAGIEAALAAPVHEMELHLGFAEGRKRAWLFDEGVVEAEDQNETGFSLSVRWTDLQAARFAKL